MFYQPNWFYGISEANKQYPPSYKFQEMFSNDQSMTMFCQQLAKTIAVPLYVWVLKDFIKHIPYVAYMYQYQSFSFSCMLIVISRCKTCYL